VAAKKKKQATATKEKAHANARVRLLGFTLSKCDGIALALHALEKKTR